MAAQNVLVKDLQGVETLGKLHYGYPCSSLISIDRLFDSAGDGQDRNPHKVDPLSNDIYASDDNGFLCQQESNDRLESMEWEQDVLCLPGMLWTPVIP